MINYNQKKLFILFLIVFLSITSMKAQYIPYYNPYLVAEHAVDELVEKQHIQALNNIRFDENALRESPEVWNNYLTYQSMQNSYSQKCKKYDIMAFTGLGIEVLSLIPALMYLNCSYDDPMELVYDATFWTMLSGGAVVGLVGCLGSLSINSKIRQNKEDFIFYLKTCNNGIGIVTLF